MTAQAEAKPMHTPVLPFTVEHGVEVYDAHSCAVADCGDSELTTMQKITHARFIVTACNNHANLLAALKALKEGCRATEYREPLSHAQLADMATAALAKAGG